MDKSVAAARDRLILAIRRRAPREEQLRHADAYIESVRAYAKAAGRRCPVPNRLAVLRQFS